MAYVKSGNPGKITMDLPRSSYIYELPLLSFGDYHGKLDLSLIFNYQMKYGGDNSFCIKEGYKLNVQKQLIFNDGVPKSLQEANGNCTNLIGDGFPYAFDDDSMRILRYSAASALPYTIENEDYSKELYDVRGRLMSVIDKYGRTILSYTYSGTQNKLLRLVFYANYIIEFMYTNDCLTSFKYKNANCTTELAYTDTGITVTHYSGETYQLELTDDMNFSATASTTGHATKLNKASDYSIVLSDYIGTQVVNTTTYGFYSTVNGCTSHSYVEITNHEGVKTRNEYWRDQLAYSYEVTDSDVSFIDNRFAGSVQIYKTMENPYFSGALGTHNRWDGVDMVFKAKGTFNNPVSDQWVYRVNAAADKKAEGYYVLTGWVKLGGDGDSRIYIESRADGLGENVVNPRYVYDPGSDQDRKWKFFAYRLYADDEYVRVHLPADTPLETKDFRLTFQETHTTDETGKSRIAMMEYGLIPSEKASAFIPLEDCEFVYMYTTEDGGIEETVFENDPELNEDMITFADLLKHNINTWKNVHHGEVFANACRKVFTLGCSGIFIAKYTNPKTKVVTEHQVNNCGLGVQQWVANQMVTTEIKIDSDNRLVYETKNEAGTVIANKTLNTYQDIIAETSEGVTTTYNRNYDLVTKVEVTGGNNTYTRQTTYGTDNSGNLLIKEKDEFDKETKYILDPIWGAVKSVTLPDHNVVADTYDDDCCAHTNRAFDSESTRSNTIGYSGGNVSSLESGYLSYGFTYTKGKLTAVTKNGTKIEEHTHTGNTRVKSYYPNKTNPLHSIDAMCDMYGRLTSIDGVLSNVYDISPTFNSSNGNMSAVGNNKDALLAKTTDHVLGEVARFTYRPDGTLKNKEVTSSSAYSDKISTESFTYDAINRLTEDACTYNSPANRKVTSTIVYATAHDNPHADQRIATYTYAVGSANAAVTTNQFDAFKRVTSKMYTIGTRTFTKSFGYNATRVETVEDSVGGATNYTYDECGRLKTVNTGGKTTTYHYDAYGQLVREDNQALDKTLVYDYSSNTGNLLRVKQYAYTTAATLGDSYTKIAYGYTRDQINSYSGTAITNNTMGCPSTHGDMNLTWTKGKLSKAFSGSRPSGIGTYEYGYNAYGQRVSKSFSFLEGSDVQPQTGQLTGMEKQYFYDHAGRLIAEETTSTFYESAATTERIVFLYDESGIIGMRRTLNGTTSYYYFKRNLLGDVTAIYNSSGTMVAKYLYDAYGNCTYSGTTSIALANPIRYRGYYYDDETGLYYLNARYYSPMWRRFISPDDSEYLDPESVNGLNQYCYCNNDPVNYVDPSGHFLLATLLVSALVSSAVSVGANILGQVIFDGKSLGTLDWRKVAIAGASGFGAGLILGTGFVSIASRAVVSSFVENGLRAIWLDEEFEIAYVVRDSIMSLATGYAMKGISHLTSRLTSKIFHKAPNYSQYQHYFRQKGHDYCRQEVYKHMERHMRYKGNSEKIIDSILDFSFSFLTYPL